jgi:hypothetical protein
MGVPAEVTDDRFVRSDLMFPWLSNLSVHFRFINSGGYERACQISPFLFFGHLFAVFVGGAQDDWLGSARGNGSTKALDWRCRI